MDLQEQVNAYTAWINSQLKKRSQQIQDLSLDLKDGYALATVIEIVSGEKLDVVKSTSEEDKKNNLLKILKFMKGNGIKLHHISVEDIIAGNAKAIMQLILAIAAHFKPSSIGGRKISHVEKSHGSPAVSARWKKNCEGDSSPGMIHDAELKLQAELETDLSNVRQLAENLQQLLLEELEQQPIKDPHPFEDSSILQAKLDKITCEKERLQIKFDQIQSEIHNFRTEKTVLETRVHHHEQEILALRQDLMRSNLEKDRLLAEKADLDAELEETHSLRDRYMKQAHRKELLVQELKDEIRFSQTEHVILMSRKDKEIAQLQKQINNQSNFSEEDYRDSAIIKLSNSPVFSHSAGYLRSSASPKLSRRSPLSKSNPSRKNKYQQNQSEVVATRVLYFSDRNMTPSMTSIPKSVGDITLQDFKDATNKDGNFRYIFKALDPELGTVKEEVFRDDDILPGWEGKIVAWIEEEVRV